MVKRTGWRKFVDFLGLSVEANLYKVGKLKVHFYVLGIYQDLHLEIPIYQDNVCTNSLIWNQQTYGCNNSGEILLLRLRISYILP